MLKITDLKIDIPSTVGSTMLLVEVRPRFEYQNGQRTDTITGYSYIAVLPDRAFEKLSVRIDGPKLMDEPEEGSYMNVAFDDLDCSSTGHRASIQSAHEPPVFIQC